MMVRKVLICVVAAAVCFTALFAAQQRIDTARSSTDEELLLYLPNEKLLNHFTAGLSSVIADFLWLQCIQYTGKHFRSDLKFTWLNHMCTTITRLDPYFVDVYRMGGMFLAALQGDDDASIILLKKGIRHNPGHWELPYEIAMVYLLNRRDEPGSADMAVRYLAMAVGTGKAPDWVIELASNLNNVHNTFDVERDMWTNLLASDDKLMREMAHRKLLELTIRENLSILGQAAEIYENAMGRPPAHMDDLVNAGILVQLPEDPLGGQFFVDKTGKPQNTTLLDQRVSRILAGLRASIDTFWEKNSRWPASLQELVDSGITQKVHAHPYRDREWTYDPATGSVK